MKVLIAEQFEQSGRDGLAGLGCEVVFDPAVTAEALPEVVTRLDPTVLVVRGKKVKAPAIVAGNALKLIIRAGAGYDNIDLQAATAKGVAVCNCPGMNAVAVAELAMGLLISCDRRIPDQCIAARSGQWNKREFSKARGLKGMTLGVVGVGAIGQEVVKRAAAFDMHVLAWSRGITPQHAKALNCEFVGEDSPALMTLAKRSDAVSVHLPLENSTKKLFNKTFFDAMKPGAYFINTSRGGVVDEAALRDAILNKGLRVGMDVYENQPSETAGPFASETVQLTTKGAGVYTTHHCGASTDQAQMAVAMEAVRIVKVYAESGRVENCVNA